MLKSCCLGKAELLFKLSVVLIDEVLIKGNDLIRLPAVMDFRMENADFRIKKVPFTHSLVHKFIRCGIEALN